MMTGQPDFNSLLKAEEEILAARLKAVRAGIEHNGEKGRILETHVRSMVRKFLPGEFGLGTGFIVSMGDANEPTLSSQLDIIIYDAVRGGPVADLDGVEVYPLEAVYAYIEVKTTFSKELSGVLRQSSLIRKLTRRRYLDPDPKAPAQITPYVRDWPPPRSFVVAFESGWSGKQGDQLEAQAMEAIDRKCTKAAGLHGVLVPEGFFAWHPGLNFEVAPRPLTADRPRALASTNNPIGAFKSMMLSSLARFPRVDSGMQLPYPSYLLAQLPNAESTD